MYTAQFRLCAIFIGLVIMSGCSASQDVAEAEAQVAHFRNLMTARQFDQVYAESSDELKKATTLQDLAKLLSAVDRKLGAVKSAAKSGWNVNASTAGTFVNLGFKTQFENGNGDETFTYRVSDGKALLAGYHITSNALVVE